MNGAASSITYRRPLRRSPWLTGLLEIRMAGSGSGPNLALALDFEQPNYTAPLYALRAGLFGGVCVSATAAGNEETAWTALQALSRSSGFTLP
jgi:hypothetical protein